MPCIGWICSSKDTIYVQKTTRLIFQLSIISIMIYRGASLYKIFFYLDPRNEINVKKPEDVDTDFDAMVPIHMGPEQAGLTLTTGILIDRDRVLTSFNPFRELSNIGDTSNFKVYKKVGMFKGAWTRQIYYNFYICNIICGRQVTYLTAEDKAIMNYTGRSGNYPLHDLMVLKIDKSVPTQYITKDRPYIGWEWFTYNPPMNIGHDAIQIEIAGLEDEMSGPMKIGSLEHRDFYAINSEYFAYMNAVYLEAEAITDCGLWFPREWGYFICVRKPKSHLGIASGAILIVQQKLYGIGSFALEKGAEGIYYVY